ncbi:MAG: cobalt-precorrin-6A reductase [Kiloniellales bacterium]|nr:cobalt-precorrin-6A reductase [Kiloniellales bacterium]
MSEPRRVLILGGTAEARDLARRLAGRPALEVVTSLAGVTRNPERPPGRLRRGGFGGAAGLEAYLRDEAVACLVDATHPYAERISANAAAAAAAAKVPRLLLLRPPWDEEPGDRWLRVRDPEEAARRLPDLGRRIFVSSGRQGISAFRALTGHWFLIRLIDPPEAPLPLPAYEVTPGRAPFTVEEEAELLRRHRIEALISKNSGGAMTYAKIAAARQLGLPVVMLDRPALPEGPRVPDSAAAADWLLRQLATVRL